jgi:hypothetical protein
MKYESISVETLAGSQNYIIIHNGDDSFTSFPADNDNPNYTAFLAALQKENPKDPHFVAWVEAGNKPEDFWAQNPDI